MRTSEHIPAGGITFDGGNRLVKKLLEWLGLRKPAQPVCEQLDSLERLLREIQNLPPLEQVAMINRVAIWMDEALSISEALQIEIRSVISESLIHADELHDVIADPAFSLGGYILIGSGRSLVAEGPTSVCMDCGRLVKPEELYVGKQSGMALCEACLGIWVAAGRAKQGAEF